MPRSANLRCTLVVLAIVSCMSLQAPRFGPIWSDEMALQHGLPFNISGFAHPMSTLVPLIDNAPAGGPVTCGADGTFVIEFAAQQPTRKDLNLQQGHVLSVCYTSDATNCASIEDVVFGDVFLCSGQSNMAYGLSSAYTESDDWREHLRFAAGSSNAMGSSSSPMSNGEMPGIRLLTIARLIGAEDDVTTALNVSFTTSYDHAMRFIPSRILTRMRRYAWTRADDVTIFASAPSPWDLPFFSAICLFFGYRHQQATGLPVGLISSNFGGTKIEMWSSRQAIKQCPPPQMPSGGFEEPPTVFEYPEICLEPAIGGNRCSMSFYSFGSLFYGMIAPVSQQKLKGILWYQGESNIGASSMYKCQLQALVADYRLSFGQPDLPFVVVQLCPTGLATPEFDWTIARRQYNAEQVDAMRRSSSFLRLSQELALTLPNTALAVTADLGDRNSSFGSIHPRNKREIARRLYLEFSAMLQAEQTTSRDGNRNRPTGQAGCRPLVRPCYGLLEEHNGVDSVLAVKFVSNSPLVFNGTAFCVACCNLSPFEIIFRSRTIAHAPVIGIAQMEDDLPDVWTVHIRVPAFEPEDVPVLVAFMHTDEPQCALYNSHGMPAGPFVADIHSREIVQSLHTIPKEYLINK